MVYDCFQFFNELDILKIRMNILSDVVDRFVISEATETFSGMPKPLYYEENKDLFSEFSDRIIHVVVEDTPPMGPGMGTHERDTFQKNAVTRGLKDCTDEDVIIFSDLDEIPDPNKVRAILQDFDDTKIYHFAQRLFYCYLNMEEVSGSLLAYGGDFPGYTGENAKWIGTRMLSYRLLKEQGLMLGELRFPERKEIGVRVADGGWHFGYMGGKGESDVKKRISAKVVSAAHQEYNSRYILSRTQDLIKDGQDIFGRDARFVRREIDESYPEYIRTHKDEFSHFILKKETSGERTVRHIKMGAVGLIHRVGVPVKRVIKKIIRRGS